MLPSSRYIVSLIYFNSLVRDSLEYTVHRDNFDVKFYDYKKNGIINEPKLQSPLNHLLSSTNEAGESLRKEIVELGEFMYGDKSTVLHVENENVKVDHNQDVRIFELVIPVHEKLGAAIRANLPQIQNDPNFGEDDKKVFELVEIDEKFYRAVALFTLSHVMIDKFREFNNLMREEKGVKGPAANFVESELNSLMRCFMMVKQNSRISSDDYMTPLDAVDHMVEMMLGKRQVPQGQTFQNVFADVNQKVNAFLLVSEGEWRQAYQPCVEKMIAENQAARKAQEEAKAKESA